MTEKIYIDGFAGLNNFEMELNRINVLIGPQASGKSVVAKLVYFFNEMLIDYTKFILTEKEDELNEFVTSEFKQIFNLNLLKNSFIIIYERTNFRVKIIRKDVLNITFSKDAAYNIFAQKSKFKRELRYLPSDLDLTIFFEKNLEKIGDLTGIDLNFGNFFVPASRSFTSLIKNIKLMIANQRILAAIDPYLLRFSATYQQHRQQFRKDSKGLISKESNNLDFFIKSLINANVEFINDEDYLVYENGRRVALTDASSGEQALVPILVYLKLLHQKGKQKLKTNIYFEEPELHIFPKFQFTLMQLLMFMFNECNVRLFVTTHSPYILSAFNDFMQAAELEEIYKDDPKKLEQLYKIVSKNEIIQPKDLNAYEIENGKARILDREHGLISGNIIDKVSEEGSIKFGELLDLLPADA